MTVHAILGLAALNGAYAVLGVTLLWAIRGLPRWSDVLRLAGLGYLLGVAAFGTVWTLLLVVGVPFGRLGARALARVRHRRRGRRRRHPPPAPPLRLRRP